MLFICWYGNELPLIESICLLLHYYILRPLAFLLFQNDLKDLIQYASSSYHQNVFYCCSYGCFVHSLFVLFSTYSSPWQHIHLSISVYLSALNTSTDSTTLWFVLQHLLSIDLDVLTIHVVVNFSLLLWTIASLPLLTQYFLAVIRDLNQLSLLIRRIYIIFLTFYVEIVMPIYYMKVYCFVIFALLYYCFCSEHSFVI